MFSTLKKSKTVRSFLGAISLFAAGAPAVAEAAQKEPIKMTLPAQTDATRLTSNYKPLCAQLEGNLPFCYKDKGVVTVGCGVHLKDYKGLLDLSGIQITFKKGTVFNLERRAYLKKMADANWRLPKTISMFSEVESVKFIKLKDCPDEIPVGGDKKTDKGQLVLVSSENLEKINQSAADFCMRKAQEFHPNLFRLPPSAQMVVVDLIYNLGYEKYLSSFPKFQKAVAAGNLTDMKKECHTKNKRRDTIRDCLMDAAILSKSNPRLTKEQLLKQIRIPVVKSAPKLDPKLEKVLWKVLDSCAMKSFDWCQSQTLSKMLAVNNKKSYKK